MVAGYRGHNRALLSVREINLKVCIPDTLTHKLSTRPGIEPRPVPVTRQAQYGQYSATPPGQVSVYPRPLSRLADNFSAGLTQTAA